MCNPVPESRGYRVVGAVRDADPLAETLIGVGEWEHR